jgi:ABC-type bacteriocin/lantibiotic exporter with double-glycine peptidase domain
MYSFFLNEKFGTLFIIVSGCLISIIETYGISKNIAEIISTAQSGNIVSMEKLIQVFCILSTLYVFFNFLYEKFKNDILIKLRYWIRSELIRILMKSNNENFTDKNFIKLNSPINRISNVTYFFMNDVFTYLIPSIIFILVVFGFFTYNDPKMGSIFIFANMFLLFYIVFSMPTIIKKNTEYELDVNENESHVLEMLNNMDKIVYRGQTKEEEINLKKITDVTINKSKDFYLYVNIQESILIFMMYFIIAMFLIYNIQRVKNKKINQVLFITFITIIMLYRDKIGVVIWQISNFVEFAGRAKGVMEHYNDAILLGKPPNPGTSDYKSHREHHDYLFGENKYKPVSLEFNKITFKNVSFKYRTKDVYVLKNFNMELNLNNKIIGFTGVSGRGKTTLMKLVLKMYKNYEGEIYIDDVNIRDIDPDYLRKNIIYVNQNSKLFDRLIIENIMYGCQHTKTCDVNLNNVIKKYPKIRALFKDNDIYTTRVGPLGEKMSGGQRMTIAILTGLISPSSCGLVLDEPTTGLDPELKKEIIDLIRENRNNKKFIIIISHDKDVYRIFDEKKEI